MRNNRRVVALEKAMRPTRMHIIEVIQGSSEEGAIERYRGAGNDISLTDIVVLIIRLDDEKPIAKN